MKRADRFPTPVHRGEKSPDVTLQLLRAFFACDGVQNNSNRQRNGSSRIGNLCRLPSEFDLRREEKSRIDGKLL